MHNILNWQHFIYNITKKKLRTEIKKNQMKIPELFNYIFKKSPHSIF